MESYEGSSWWERLGLTARLRYGFLRLRGGWLQILQTALATCLAWVLAVLLLGLDRPTFAPIAAVISLGLAVGERDRRAVELTLAVASGVAIADLLVSSVVGMGGGAGGGRGGPGDVARRVGGRGRAWREGDRDLGDDRDDHLPGPGGTDLPVDRFFEALIGGGTALLVKAARGAPNPDPDAPPRSTRGVGWRAERRKMV